jgi:hypothetical protein
LRRLTSQSNLERLAKIVSEVKQRLLLFLGYRYRLLFFSRHRSRQPDLYGGNTGEDETTKAAFEDRKEELQQDKKELEDCLQLPVIEELGASIAGSKLVI